MEVFNVKDCKHVGCLNNYKGTCTLDKLSIATFAVPLAYFQNSTVCMVRQQINKYKTNNLIENK